ncbi:hypothetical protein A4R26_13270 [Niastella populi]|uniref:Uncharacterized protein n=1 Tax=Niastella populi TaxID=550983 RepID=A0A1V9G8E0_9BACT|nr:hypothetical protein A4R26_13270 [Niastella populi]
MEAPENFFGASKLLKDLNALVNAEPSGSTKAIIRPASAYITYSLKTPDHLITAISTCLIVPKKGMNFSV